VTGPAAFLLVAQAAASPPAAAAAPADRVQVLRTLVVAPGETVDDAVCLGCGIVVQGRVRGDAIAVLGGVDVQGESGRGAGDEVIAAGGAVHVGGKATVPASIVSIGGPVRIEPGAAASYDVDSLPWLHVPGQRQVFLEGAVSFLAFVMAVAIVGAVLDRAPGIAARDSALARAPLARGLLGTALVLALAGVLSNGERLGRFEDLVQAVLGLAVLVALVAGLPGVASLLGRGLVRLAGRALAPGWRSATIGASALALLCLVPLVGAAAALGALALACGGAVARRVTLSASSPDEVPR